ncbi:di-/tripeptide transporter [Aquipluma nitroreducens]|uniref:Di-/tripeptide transporter n=1 Tax=Aquipluma nitroreducens TaxID=2010828 RepID=A0A5K7SD48_9BACT|nr:peptide MFS transporter [Aquipluma nitroreducens]BBE19184.1 di-/tripeptide transporter [Aquipluma nitroreducens]
MLKGHPRGLLVAFFANMGERFGFYTMMAILVLFLQARFGLTEQAAGDIYSWFYFGIYALALIGGILADYTKKYKLVIFAGIAIMLAGYASLAIPGMTLTVTVISLFVIAFGNGLFKGNLQAVVGQLYDDPKYSKMRDSAFMIFYMGINVGAFFAPFAATGIRNWWLGKNGLLHDGSLPSLCHQYINGTLTDTTQFSELATKASVSGSVTDLGAFAHNYLEVFSRGYNYAFGIAAGAMIISMLVYIFFQSYLPNAEKQVEKADKKTVKTAEEANSSQTSPIAIFASLVAATIVTVLTGLVLDYKTGMAFGLFAAFVTWITMISTKEEKPKVTSLILVFFVVIFFWMSFHQNGLTLTFFARDYIVKEVGAFTYLFFDMWSILAVITTVAGLFVLIGKEKTTTTRLIGAGMTLVGGGASYYFMSGNGSSNAIAPEVFQSFNPLFIVALTTLVMGVFAMLNKAGKEPSTPKKIGIGMIIAAGGFLLVLIASVGLISPHTLAGQAVPEASRVSPYWLINSYLILTVAELFLSPMGLSFVSKVAPQRFQGLMQGGWLLATAVGNKLLFVGSFFWGKLELWQLWLIFIVCILVSATVIFSIMKRLETATK